MPSLPRRSTIIVAALLSTVGLGACGNADTRVTTGTYAGESGANAPYLNVGPLIYEVQLSRQLNPADTEDSAYLQGLSPAQRKLAPGQEWFAVFLQVYNNTSAPHPSASSVTISDTEGTRYLPVVPHAGNMFVYRSSMVPSKGRVPAPDTVAANGPTQGALLLYKISVGSLDNRPLEVRIVDPGNPHQTAQAELDV